MSSQNSVVENIMEEGYDIVQIMQYRGERVRQISYAQALPGKQQLAIVLTLVANSETDETYRQGLHKHTIPQSTKAAPPPISK